MAELRMDREFLKKAAALLRHGELEPEQAFAVIDAEKATPNMPPVARMAHLLGVSRSGYYAWAERAGRGGRGGRGGVGPQSATLKTEFYHRHSLATRAESITATSTWIDEAYSRRRRHSSLGHLSPEAFENTHITTAAKAAQLRIADVHETGPTPVAT